MITKKQQRYSFVIALFQIVMVLVLLGLWLKYQEQLPTAYLLQVANTLFIGAIISLLAWQHNSLSWKSFVEKRERSTTEQKKNIFTDDADFAGRYEKSFLQFNKVLLPFILVFISLFEGFLSLRLWWSEIPELASGTSTLLVPVAVLFTLSLLSFLAGKFTSGLAHNEKHSFLRPVCGYLLYSSFTMFAAATCALFYHFQVKPPLLVFLSISILLSTCLAVERLLLWGVDMYRPKSKNEEYLPVYESRILALFSQPRGVLGNFATMLEYQFGLKISESLFSSFLKRAFIPYLCIQVLSLFALSSLTYIKPHENGLKMTWGDTQFSILEPGLHLTAPWPIAKVERYDVQRVKEINLTESQKFEESYKKDAVDTWDNPEYDSLVNMSNQNKSQNLAVINVRMTYKIDNVLRFRSAYVNSENALIMTGKETLSRMLLESDFEDVLKGGLREFTDRMKNDLKGVCLDEFGVELIDIAVINFQPPPQVVPAYQSVYAAREDQIRLSTEAEKYNVGLLSKTAIQADLIQKKAEGETIRKRLLLETELKSFNSQKEIYRKIPVLYRAIAKMDAIENMLKNVRKVVNLTGIEKEIITLELKKSTPDLLELE
jgi:regulator of protease activity HflC (stomatin/prohibitin superfamily)